ncbi:stringent starvation protein B [Legionella geestiana]|uniref:Stringent starvation protein B n=1 Tax=Legionella geestiana TaxID=45065 RepID=A0A0W0TMR7_9GAMM|nr:ClpXP protease specificity-enhancing factor [Legionella geestiana]KTC96517.1 stringent starvation protein B [Legionella geestiana]QBS12556.1 ClpXP protease specificity-enhancing factor [Legionella geestiana]STX54995.1 stringent starvation protein B [Legionella geestiana]
MSMTSAKPHLVRAMYDWIVDNALTPYLVVNATWPGVQVPEEHVIDGRIILNISPQACRGLHLENDKIIFTARFSGMTTQIFVPPAAVLAIYAKENGRGMEFGEEYDEPPPTTPVASDIQGASRTRPSLKLVK